MYNYSTEELITDALAQVNDGMYSYGQALALIAIAKSLANIDQHLEHTRSIATSLAGMTTSNSVIAEIAQQQANRLNATMKKMVEQYNNGIVDEQAILKELEL